MANSLDMLTDPVIEKIIEDQIVEENGKIKFPLNVGTGGNETSTVELLALVDAAKSEITPDDEGAEEAPKLQTLAKGFMFQAGKAMSGSEPFYLETHLIGENQYAISANKNGVLTRNDIKALRKSLKSMMNQEKEEYNPESQDDGPQSSWGPTNYPNGYDDSVNDSYYEEV